jgi:hypothetical protein
MIIQPNYRILFSQTTENNSAKLPNSKQKILSLQKLIRIYLNQEKNAE